MLKPLSPKHKRFVDEYLVDGNATQAAIRAGYSQTSAQVSASRLLDKDHIKAYLETAQKRVTKKLDIKRERILKEYARIAFSDMAHYVTWDAGGLVLFDSKELKSKTRAVAEVSEFRGKQGTKVTFKLHDKQRALDALCKMLGIAPDQLQITGKDGGPVQVEHHTIKIGGKEITF